MAKTKKLLSIVLLLVISFGINAQKQITVSDIWQKYSFFGQGVDEVVSMSDGKSYTALEDDEINKYDYKSGKKEATLFAKDPQIKKINDYKFNDAETQILISTEKEQIYRHSFSANYFVYDINEKMSIPVSKNGKQQIASFSKDGKVAFVRDNNIFIKDFVNYAEKQITTDGLVNSIINGIPDWVYEEEFSFSKAYEWSPDGTKLAYLKFNEDWVKEYNMTTYGELYPSWYRYKYPKAGEKNSIVSLHIYDVKTQQTTTVDVGEEKDQYIPRIKWTKDSNILSFIRLNRLQNKWELLFTDASTGLTKVILTQTSEKYIEIDDNLTFLDDKSHFVVTSESDDYNHIYMYDINGGSKTQITKGNWTVTKLYGIYDNTIYFQSSELSPMNRDIYSVKLNGSSKTRLSTEKGTNDAEFSSTFKYFINTYSSANTPALVTLCDNSGKKIKDLQLNGELKNKINEYGFSRKEFFNFKTEEGVELNGWMIKPKMFDATKKYPVFMYVYGGPGSQTVEDSWDTGNLPWFQLLAQKGYIIVSIDNRGTGARGAQFRQQTYKQLGKLETEDQIAGAKYLGTQSYVDAKRIGIFGWSYGGYMSTLCLSKGAEYFKMAIAVAPVTNWRFYDSIYTERYMGLPQDNSDGYDSNSPINHVGKIKGKLLLVHGTSDDNVHFQNSIELVTNLVNAGVQFDMNFYPNSNHGIYTGRNTRFHLYTKMTNFIEENL